MVPVSPQAAYRADLQRQGPIPVGQLQFLSGTASSRTSTSSRLWAKYHGPRPGRAGRGKNRPARPGRRPRPERTAARRFPGLTAATGTARRRFAGSSCPCRAVECGRSAPLRDDFRVGLLGTPKLDQDRAGAPRIAGWSTGRQHEWPFFFLRTSLPHLGPLGYAPTGRHSSPMLTKRPAACQSAG